MGDTQKDGNEAKEALAQMPNSGGEGVKTVPSGLKPSNNTSNSTVPVTSQDDALRENLSSNDALEGDGIPFSDEVDDMTAILQEADMYFGYSNEAITEQDLANMEELEQSMGQIDFSEDSQESSARDFCVCCFGGSCGANAGNPNFVHKEEYPQVMAEIDDPSARPSQASQPKRPNEFDEPAPYCPEGMTCNQLMTCPYNHPHMPNCGYASECSRDTCKYNHPVHWILPRLPEDSFTSQKQRPKQQQPAAHSSVPASQQQRFVPNVVAQPFHPQPPQAYYVPHDTAFDQFPHGADPQYQVPYSYNTQMQTQYAHHQQMYPYEMYSQYHQEDFYVPDSSYSYEEEIARSFCDAEVNGNVCPLKKKGCAFNHNNTAECRSGSSCQRDGCQFNHPWEWVFGVFGWEGWQ